MQRRRDSQRPCSPMEVDRWILPGSLCRMVQRLQKLDELRVAQVRAQRLFRPSAIRVFLDERSRIARRSRFSASHRAMMLRLESGRRPRLSTNPGLRRSSDRSFRRFDLKFRRAYAPEFGLNAVAAGRETRVCEHVDLAKAVGIGQPYEIDGLLARRPGS
jgi:hypothetical protein